MLLGFHPNWAFASFGQYMLSIVQTLVYSFICRDFRVSHIGLLVFTPLGLSQVLGIYALYSSNFGLEFHFIGFHIEGFSGFIYTGISSIEKYDVYCSNFGLGFHPLGFKGYLVEFLCPKLHG